MFYSLHSFYLFYLLLRELHRVNLKFSFSRCFIIFIFLILNNYVMLCYDSISSKIFLARTVFNKKRLKILMKINLKTLR